MISRLDRLFGWFFTGTGQVVAPELHGKQLDKTPQLAITVLRKELRRVFSDREIRLLKNLIAILEQMTVSTADAPLFSGISSFEYVWEDMCAVLFKDQSKKFSPLIPLPAYVMRDGKIKAAPQNKQIMDVIVEENGTLAILDAKYYDMDKNPPGWGDIVKQLFYAKSLKSVLQGYIRRCARIKRASNTGTMSAEKSWGVANKKAVSPSASPRTKSKFWFWMLYLRR